jgi:hypothetical protein
MSHTMKLWERVIEYRLRKLTTVSKNQFGFILRRSTMKAIFYKIAHEEISKIEERHIYDIY